MSGIIRMDKKLVCGVDEAGRGCVLGSLIVAAVVYDPDVLAKIPVADSKKLSKKRRNVLAEEIRNTAVEVSVYELTADEINRLHAAGKTLNEMEIIAFGRALKGIQNCQPAEIYMDAADVFEDRFEENIILELGDAHEAAKIIAEHKADLNIPVVSAASIIAKTRRDESIAELLPVSVSVSGYCDSKTQKWLREYYVEHSKFPDHTRTFWKTLDKIKAAVNGGEY